MTRFAAASHVYAAAASWVRAQIPGIPWIASVLEGRPSTDDVMLTTARESIHPRGPQIRTVVVSLDPKRWGKVGSISLAIVLGVLVVLFFWVRSIA